MIGHSLQEVESQHDGSSEIIRPKHQTLKLRHHRVPFEYVATEDELYADIDRRNGSLGRLQLSSFSPSNNAKQPTLAPKNVKHAGGYTWIGPVTIADVVDMHAQQGKASQERRFITPGQSLSPPTRQGRIMLTP